MSRFSRVGKKYKEKILGIYIRQERELTLKINADSDNTVSQLMRNNFKNNFFVKCIRILKIRIFFFKFFKNSFFRLLLSVIIFRK